MSLINNRNYFARQWKEYNTLYCDVLKEVWEKNYKTIKEDDIGCIPSRCIDPVPPEDQPLERPNNCYAKIGGRNFGFAYYHSGGIMQIWERED